MRLAAAVALLLCAPAFAQVPWPQPPCEPLVELRPVAEQAPRPIGTPVQLKGSCATVLEANDVGGAVAFWCRQTAPKPPLLYLYAVRWSAITPDMLLDAAMLGLPGGDNRDRIQAMQQRHQTEHVLDMCDVWDGMRARIDAAKPQ